MNLFSSAVEPGRQSGFLVLLAFLVSFGCIRTSARLMRSPRVPWWPGSVQAGGVHLHHLVWGIGLLLVSGFATFAADLSAPWWQISATAFGVGAGLTLDEFALWVYLRDVYWAEEGRKSVDAVILAAVAASLVLIGVRPFGLDDAGSVLGALAVTLLALGLAAIAFLKGRMLLGVVALFIPFAGALAACRLARPSSPWARRRYTADRADRARRAAARYASDRRLGTLGRRLRELVGGAPDAP